MMSSPTLLRVPDIAARLGITVSATRHLIESRQLPVRKLGGRVVVLADELESFLRALPER
jgi:excisionase family DNA binding protein